MTMSRLSLLPSKCVHQVMCRCTFIYGIYIYLLANHETDRRTARPWRNV